MPHAIVRLPAPSLASDCALTHIARTPIDFARIGAQHAAYIEVLRAACCTIDVLPALPAFPDSVFVEDAAVALPGLTILTQPGTPSREAEPGFLLDALAKRALAVARIQAPATLDGGDVLRIGRRLYVGQGTRTNAQGLAQLSALCTPIGFDVVGVPLGPSLHLKTAVTALDDETLLANVDWVDVGAFGAMQVLKIDHGEPFAANVLRLDGTLVVNAAFPATRRIVESHARSRGLAAHAVDIGEFGKAEAGLTCLSVVVPTDTAA
jgi:dimethylargininase